MHGSVGIRIGMLTAVGYLGAVAAIEVARHSGLGPHPEQLASSPTGVLSGHVVRLLTSGFVVAGAPVAQLAGAATATAAVLVLLGPAAFWRAAFAGHVVATLVTYAGVGALWLIARADVGGVADAPDFGFSCVWAATLGVLAAVGLRSSRRRLVLIAAGGATLLRRGDPVQLGTRGRRAPARVRAGWARRPAHTGAGARPRAAARGSFLNRVQEAFRRRRR